MMYMFSDPQTMNGYQLSSGQVFPLTQKLRKEHQLYLLKHSLLVATDPQLALGPLNMPPERTPQLPVYVIKERLSDSGDSYVLGRGDQQGESKLDKFGRLQGSRQYLFTTFTLPQRQPTLYVLVSDLMKSLGERTNQSVFLETYSQLFPVKANEGEKRFLVEHGVLSESENDVLFVTVKSTFMLFGARVIVGGTRIVDDYWEQIVREQGFLPHHRVFVIPDKILKTLKNLKPSIDESKWGTADQSIGFNGESPYATVSEQRSWELRQEYARECSNGHHLSLIVPGQTIEGSLELSAQFKQPKYHSKHSMQVAFQTNSQDTPISKLPSHHSGFPPVSLETARKNTGSRLLSDITESSIAGKFPKHENQQALDADTNSQGISLNINGWKFDSLPLKHKDLATPSFSNKGLPLYQPDRLIYRLKQLTPNDVNEMEHAHDSIYLNTGLQKVRKTRKEKWMKYWQYKAGAPIGMTQIEADLIIEKHLSDLLAHVDTETTFNEAKNMEEIYITKRIPNANFLGNSNITGLKPPYVNNR